jgi:hypothetical protein
MINYNITSTGFNKLLFYKLYWKLYLQYYKPVVPNLSYAYPQGHMINPKLYVKFHWVLIENAIKKLIGG